MIQFDSNTTDGLYCGSSDTCSVPATTRSPFSKVHLHPSSSPQRARVRCFSFFCLHLFIIRLKKLWNSDLRVKAYPNFLHRWRQKNGIPSRAKHNVSTNCGWRRRVKAGIANSLSVRCARACPFARTHVRMREQRVTWWAKKRASFQKKQGGSREKKGRFARNSTSFYSASPHSRKTKHFFRKTFDYSKLNPYFYAW